MNDDHRGKCDKDDESNIGLKLKQNQLYVARPFGGRESMRHRNDRQLLELDSAVQGVSMTKGSLIDVSAIICQ